MVECLLRNLTQSHLNILEVFVRLATSHYSKVSNVLRICLKFDKLDYFD